MELVDIGIADRPDHERRRFFSDDGYHPSDEGYAAWAVAVWAFVSALIPPPPVLRPRLATSIA
jgi:lysophospholipase L1-like esterase